LVKICNEIIVEYQAQGFTLTLRQLYYQFVSGTIIAKPPKDTNVSLDRERCAPGRADHWHAIEDRTRNLQRLSHWNTPEEIVKSCAQSYHMDMWERAALSAGSVDRKGRTGWRDRSVCDEFDIPYFSCRGYTSQSEMWAASRQAGFVPRADSDHLSFGDHDPSGKDMTRDITERLEMFMGGLEVKRMALNMNQVEQYDPPPNPAKTTDSRYGAYIAEFGDESWELDALEPAVIAALIRSAVTELIDPVQWTKKRRDLRGSRTSRPGCQ